MSCFILQFFELSFNFVTVGCVLVAPCADLCDFMAGFEAVLLALYGAETKARGGRPVMINIPDLGHASLYHSPRETVGSPQPVSLSHPTLSMHISTHISLLFS